MNYNKVYDQFIKDRLENKNGKVLFSNMTKSKLNFIGYCEMHHIKPKCYGGDNSKSNLILLSASDHLFAHALLARIYKGKMVFALNQLLNFKGLTVRKFSNKKIRKHRDYIKANFIRTDASNDLLRIPIKQLDKQGNLINIFRGVDIAAKATNSTRTKIITVAKGNSGRGRKYCNGFIWAYFDETYADGTSCKLSLSEHGVIVYRLDDYGNIVKTYAGIVAASKAENMSRSAIARRCDNINNKNWIKENIK